MATLAALFAFALAPAGAFAQLTSGTTLIGTIDQPMDSRTWQVGQPFTVSNVHTANYDINGAKIYGHVASIQHAGQGTPGKIGLAYDKLNTRSGNVYQISGYTQNLAVNTKSNAGKELGSAAAGALVGGLIGHGVGAVLGAGTGAVIAKNNRQNVTISQGAVVTVVLTHARRQSTY